MDFLNMDGVHRRLSGGGLPYEDILMLAVFFACVWYGGRLATAFKFPNIPVEIGVGMLFGPYGLDLIHEFSHDYSPLQLAGFIGVGIVIFESGMHLSIEKVANWDIGPHVFTVACLGTALPIVLGIALFTALGSDPYPNGLAAGFSLAPTSVGISLTLLGRAKQLNSRMGQIIMSAAFLDDIYSIICLVVLLNLAGGNLDPVMHIIVPLITSFAFVGFGVFGSIYLPKVFPMMIDTSSCIFQRLQVDGRHLNIVDEIHMFWMILFYCLFSYVGDIIGSALLGCFVAGMMFSQVPRSHHIWEKQFKRITRWLLRLFFSATVAFSIDVSSLFTAIAFAKGLVIAAVPCLLAKIIAGVFVGGERWIVGVAMMARGEFAYLVAEQAHSTEMLNDDEYAIVLWALLWATMLTPVVFDFVLKKFVRQEFEKLPDGARSGRIGGNKFSGESSFIIHFFGSFQVGMLNEVTGCLYALGFDVKNSVSESKGGFSMGTFEVDALQAGSFESRYGGSSFLAQDDDLAKRRQIKYKMVTDLSDEKLDEIAHHLKECLNDEDAKVIFEPSAKSEDEESEPLIVAEIFGVGHRSALDDIMNMLKTKLSVEIKGSFEHNANAVGKTHYTSVYCTRKSAADVEGVQVVKSHIRRSIMTKEKFQIGDCADFRNEIGKLLKEKSLPECDVLVRMMHSDSIVYTTSSMPQDFSGAGASPADTATAESNGTASSPGGTVSKRRSSGTNIIVDRKFTLSDIDLSTVSTYNKPIQNRPVQSIQMSVQNAKDALTSDADQA